MPACQGHFEEEGRQLLILVQRTSEGFWGFDRLLVNMQLRPLVFTLCQPSCPNAHTWNNVSELYASKCSSFSSVLCPNFVVKTSVETPDSVLVMFVKTNLREHAIRGRTWGWGLELQFLEWNACGGI